MEDTAKYRKMLRDQEDARDELRSRRLDFGFKMTCLGFAAAGVWMLLSGLPVDGIG